MQRVRGKPPLRGDDRQRKEDGEDVEPLRTWNDAINSEAYDHCKEWTGP